MQDNGRGMPHDDIPNMFGRGFCFYLFKVVQCSIPAAMLALYAKFKMLLCSFIWNKIWVETNTWEIRIGCKDGECSLLL